MKNQLYKCQDCTKEQEIIVSDEVLIRFVACKNTDCTNFNRGTTLISHLEVI